MSEKKTAIEHIPVHPETLYYENNKTSKGLIKSENISIHIKDKRISFKAKYVGSKKSFTVKFKMEQIGQIHFHPDGRVVIKIEPIDSVSLEVKLKNPEHFHRVSPYNWQEIYKGFYDIVIRTKSDVLFNNKYTLRKAKMYIEEEEVRGLLHENLHLPTVHIEEEKKEMFEIETPKRKVSQRKQPVRRASQQVKKAREVNSQLQQQRKQARKLKEQTKKQQRKAQPSLHSFFPKDKLMKQEEQKFEDNTLSTEQPMSGEPPSSEILDKLLTALIKHGFPEMNDRIFNFSFDLTNDILENNYPRILEKLPKREQLLKRAHWVFPIQAKNEILIFIITHPYNAHNEAIRERANRYNEDLVSKQKMKRERIDDKYLSISELESCKMIILDPNAESRSTEKMDFLDTTKTHLLSFLNFVFFKECIIPQSPLQHIDGQLPAVKVGPFTPDQSKIPAGKTLPLMYKLFFLNLQSWRPENIEQFIEMVHIGQEIMDSGDTTPRWVNLLGTFALYLYDFRFLKKLQEESENQFLGELDFEIVKRQVVKKEPGAEKESKVKIPGGLGTEALKLGKLYLESKGGVKLEGDVGKELKKMIEESVCARFVKVWSSAKEQGKQFDWRGLQRGKDDVSEEQKSGVYKD